MTSYLLSVILSYSFLSLHDDIKEDDETGCKLLIFQNYQSLFPDMKCSLMMGTVTPGDSCSSWISFYPHTAWKHGKEFALYFPVLDSVGWIQCGRKDTTFVLEHSNIFGFELRIMFSFLLLFLPELSKLKQHSPSKCHWALREILSYCFAPVTPVNGSRNNVK